MNPSHISVRSLFWRAMVMALVAALLPVTASGADRTFARACSKWPQNRLVVERGLQSRRFMLDASGEAEPLPPFLEVAARRIYHRTFSLSLDVAEPVALFHTRARRTCVIARDTERNLPLKIPVFFVSRTGQTRDGLKADAERTAFALSASLSGGDDFAEVSFRLRKGGSTFGDIRPFFACGLPGLILCEGYCPGETATLAQSLVGWVIRGVPWEPPESVAAPPPAKSPFEIPAEAPARDTPAGETPAAGASAPPPAKSQPEAPAEAPARNTQAGETPPVGASAPPAAKSQPEVPAEVPARDTPAGQTPPAETAAQQPLKPQPEAPVPAAAPKPESGQLPSAKDAVPPPSKTIPEVPVPSAPEPQPAQTSPAQGTAPPPQPQSPQPVPAAPAVPPESNAPAASGPQPPPGEAPSNPASASQPLRRLVLAFQLESGSAISAANVLKAEGVVSIEGVKLAAGPGGLIAELSENAFLRANAPETLQRSFAHHRILAVKIGETHTVLTVVPLFIRLSDLVIKIVDARQAPVKGCDLTLDVAESGRLGLGWEKPEGIHGVKLHQEGKVYVPALPADVDKNDLLISTAQAGIAARLSNQAPACELEAREDVSTEELRRGTIVRFLRGSEQILITLLSTDGHFSERLNAASVLGFWSKALDLAASVSEGPWERKLLARAQSFGPSAETGVLESLRSGRLASGAGRGKIFKALTGGSRLSPGTLSLTGSKPIERFQLDLALAPIREDAGIVPRDGAIQESLLLVTGGVDPGGNYFCRHPFRRDTPPWTLPDWVQRTRRLFVLEVWSDTAAEALQRSSRAKPAEGAPDGIYVCTVPGGDESQIALYGVETKALSDDARAGTFAYLTARANSYLKP